MVSSNISAGSSASMAIFSCNAAASTRSFGLALCAGFDMSAKTSVEKASVPS